MQNISKINIFKVEPWVLHTTELWVIVWLSNICQDVRNLQNLVLTSAIQRTKLSDAYYQRLKKKKKLEQSLFRVEAYLNWLALKNILKLVKIPWNIRLMNKDNTSSFGSCLLWKASFSKYLPCKSVFFSLRNSSLSFYYCLAIRAVSSYEWEHKVAAKTDVTGTFASRGIADSDFEEGSHTFSEITITITSQLLNCMETEE